MSVPDYSPRAEDHRSVLILLKSVGPHKSNSYNQIFERITRLNSVRIADAKRTLHLRYRRNVPLKNNEWGDFQAHRKVTGLICIGLCNSLMDIANIQANFDSIRMGYESTLYNARCFVFGLENTSLDNSQMPARPDFTYFLNFEKTAKLEDHVQDFLCSLFWILESKRLDRSSEKGDRQASLLMTPIEKKDFVGVDTDSRNFKKKIQGRMRKHLGDLCLQADMLEEAFSHYQAATEILKSANDWLWLAGSLEGMCSASVILLYPPQTLKQNFYRNPAYHSFHGSPSRLKGPRARQKLPVFEPTNGFSNTSAEVKPNKVFLQPDEIMDRYREAIIQYSKYKNAGIVEMEASIKATQVIIAQGKFRDAAEILQNMVYISLQLTDDEKTHRYNSLSSLYNQIGYHRKAAFFKRVAAMQCVAPQNTNPAWLTCHSLLIETMSSYHLPIDSREYNTESTIGWPLIQLRVLNELVFIARKLGKAPLAIRHLCYLLHTMFEYLSESEQSELALSLQAYTAKEPCPGNPIALESGLILPPVPLFKLPVVKSFALQNLPVHLRPVKMPSNQCLSSKMAVESSTVDNSSPFIYSPFQLQSTKVEEDPDQPRPAMDFEWVEGDTCEVTLRVHNPMPCELRVENLSLLTEGVEFDTFPATLTLPAKSGPHPVSIIGSPKGTGHLKILGYSTNVLGVKSVCKLRDISCIRESCYELQVVPVLPTMKAYIQSSANSKSSAKIPIKSTDNVRGATAAFTLYAGESHECIMTLQNTGRVPVEKVFISLDRSKLKEPIPEEVFNWNQENINAQLPLRPGSKLSFTICVKALAPLLATSSVANHEVPITPAPYPPHMGMLGDQTSSYQLSLIQDTQAILDQIVEGVLNIKYTGGGGHKEGYCRQLTVSITLTITPSLFLNSAKTMGATRSDQFYLVLDVLNFTDSAIRVEYGDSSQANLDKKESKRIAILTQRFSFTDQEQKLSTMEIEHLCSQQLANMVDIRWTLVESNRNGVASLDNLKLSSAMISYTRVCPIVWEVVVEGRGHDPDESLMVAIGELVEISIKITNISDSPIESVELSLKPYTNLDNDHQPNNWLQETLLFVGSSQILSVKVEPGHILELHSSFLILSRGQVKFSIQCSSLESSGGSGGESGHRRPQLWKYRPLVEINAV